MKKYNGEEKPQKRKKLLLILIPGLVFVLAFVVGIAFAAIKSKKEKPNPGFQVEVHGTVNVSANVVGRSYENNIMIENIGPIVFDGKQDKEEIETIDFVKTLNIIDREDKASFIFTITNTTQETEKTKLTIKPNCVIPEYENVVLKTYYSIDGMEYYILTDPYIELQKGRTVRVKFELTITERTVDISINGKISLELSSEDSVLK